MASNDRTIYFLSENNFNASGLELEAIVQQLDPEITLVVGGVDACPLVTDSLVQFSGLIDLSLSWLRKLRALKNDRTLLRGLDSLAIASSLVLTTKKKEIYGDEEIIVSEVIGVLHAVGVQSKSAGAETFSSPRFSTISEATKEVLAQEKGSNLINPWNLISSTSSNDEEISKLLSEHKNVLLIFDPDWFSNKKRTPDFELFDKIFGTSSFDLKQVVIETPLDASICEESLKSPCAAISFGVVALDNVSDLATCEPSNVQLKSLSAQHCAQIVDSYMRLLVNTRDELSLANVICGPTGIVDEKDFTFIRNEAKKTKMPLFQTLTSFANKAKLSGQSLLNLKDHPFAPFQKQLIEFTELMDKLQVKLEDAKCPAVALTGVTSVLRSHLLSKLNSTVVSPITDALPTLLESLTKRCEVKICKSATPKRDVSSGGSMVGLGNIQAMRQIVDFWSTLPLRNKAPNIHVLLGKSENFGNSPALLPNVLALFKSPDPSLIPTKDEDFLNEDVFKVTNVKVKPGRPKFGASLAWATDSSPIVYESPVVEATEDTSNGSQVLNLCQGPEEDYLTKNRKNAEKLLKEAKKQLRTIKTLPKRSILSEIINLENLPKDSPLLLFPPIEKPVVEPVRTIEIFFAPKPKIGGDQIPKTSTLGITTKNVFDIFVDKSPRSKDVDTSDEPPAKKPKSELPDKMSDNTFHSQPPFFTQKSKDVKAKKPACKKPLLQIKGQSKITAFMRV